MCTLKRTCLAAFFPLNNVELLDRWVGGSENLVRSLFVAAEAELRACGGDAMKSALHIVVIDEIDAVFRKRRSSNDSGEATRASCVNQILSKLDGVNDAPNVLVIGMTNRRELLDEALLRPGRKFSCCGFFTSSFLFLKMEASYFKSIQVVWRSKWKFPFLTVLAGGRSCRSTLKLCANTAA